MDLNSMINECKGIKDPGINWTWVYFESVEDVEKFKTFCEKNLHYLDWRGIITPWRQDQKWKYACTIHH